MLDTTLMDTALITGCAVAFQLGTAVLALRLIRITSSRVAWILIAVATVIQLIRRIVSLWYLLTGQAPLPIHDDMLALAISVIMFVGVASIAPLFQSIRRSEEMMRAAMLKAEEEKAKTASIIAAIGDGISIQDRDLTILYQNEIHISSFGEHLGEKCYQAYRHQGSLCTPCPVMTSIKDGKIHTTEMVKPALSGSSFFEITTSPLRDGTGQIVAGIEVVRNIDRRKKLEREKEVLISELQEALANVKTLSGLLPICASCKKIRKILIPGKHHHFSLPVEVEIFQRPLLLFGSFGKVTGHGGGDIRAPAVVAQHRGQFVELLP